jgi:hypothetical protein
MATSKSSSTSLEGINPLIDQDPVTGPDATKVCAVLGFLSKVFYGVEEDGIQLSFHEATRLALILQTCESALDYLPASKGSASHG